MIIHTALIFRGAHQAKASSSQAHQATQVLRNLFINSGAHQATQVSDDWWFNGLYTFRL